MSSSFPLYDVLFNQASNNDLTTEQKNELMNLIPTLNNKGHQNIFTIIRIYGLKNSSSGNIFDIPYEGKKDSHHGASQNDIKFNLDKLPNKVKQMLFNFVHIHLKNTDNHLSLKEDS